MKKPSRGDPALRDHSYAGLDGLNLFVALMQTGFGAFLAVYLTGRGWDAAEIGFALSLGTIAAMVTQLPGGMFVDAITEKTKAAGIAIVGVMAAALAIGFWPLPLPVLLGSALQGAAKRAGARRNRPRPRRDDQPAGRAMRALDRDRAGP